MHSLKLQEEVELSTACEFCHPIRRLVVYQTDHFSVLYDPFPLKAGHLMITTRLHFTSGGQLNSQLMQEFLQLKSHVKKILQKQYPKVICFEHAKPSEHFHFHLLPFSEDLAQPLLSTLPRRLKTAYNTSTIYFQKYGEYLYYENAADEGFFFSTEGTQLPSHYLRTVIAQINHTPERADWHLYPLNGLFEIMAKLFPRACFK